MSTILRTLIVFSLFSAALAEEGMWQPHQLPQLSQKLRNLGLKISPDRLNNLTGHPMNAVINLGHCSASFVSPEGLVITNYHCVQRILQHSSSVTNNLLEDGYLATDQSKELPGGPGNRMLVTVESINVTSAMLLGLTADIDGYERQQKLETREKTLVAQCESLDGYRCTVHSFYDGLEYYLIRQLEIRDLRLVHAPQRGIGDFGGDIDNWVWPRHAGDYAFVRGYVSPDGTPADYSSNNVPYSSDHYLTITTNGLRDGDFTMAIGYPGRTYRYRLAAEVTEIGGWLYPTRKKLYEDALAIIKRETATNETAAIRYSPLTQSFSNVIKNLSGTIEGLAHSDLVERKKAMELGLTLWLTENSTDPAAQSQAKLAALIDEYRTDREQRLIYGDFLRRHAALLKTATELYRLSREKQHADSERAPGYQERDWPEINERMKALDQGFDKQVDRALLEHHLRIYARLPNEQRIAELDRWFDLDNNIDWATLSDNLDELYHKTTLHKRSARLALLDGSPEIFENSSDPFIRLAIALYDSDIRLETKKKTFLGRFQSARSQYMATLSDWFADTDRTLYADANQTLRVTFGQVTGYKPRDAVAYEPFTTVRGLLEKHTGKDPFDAPGALIAAIDQDYKGTFFDPQLGAVPVNFLTDLDAAGGSSGSAVLDANGQLVGLLFDSNYEAIMSDWYRDPLISRSICVDIRYVLWIMETVDGAHQLLREMGIGPTALDALNPPAGVN